MDARVEFSRELSRRDLPLVPSAARGMLRALLPDGMAESLLRARLRWSPERIRLGTLYARRSREAYRFEQILRFPGDTLVTPTLSPREALETTAQVTLRPLEALSAEAVFFSVRDLLAPADAVQDPGLHPLLAGERWAAGPLDLGWETNRNLRTRVGFRPQLASWLRTDLALTTDYTSDRNAALVERAVLGSDTLLALLRSASGSRTTRASLTLDPAALARSVVEGEAGVGAESPGPGALVRALQSLDPLTVTRQGGLSSRFFREPVDPGVGFQLGWGDREGLRVLGADTAAMLTGRVSWSAATGLRLPWGVRIAGSYADSRIDILHQRSDREVRTRSWPDLRLSVAEVALPERVRGLLRTLSLGSGYRVSLTESTFGGFGLQRRTRRERQVPLELSASWAGNLTLRYRGSFAEGKGRDPTGDTRTERTSHTLLLSASLAETPVLRERLDGPLRATLGYQYSADVNCRVPAGVPGCVPFLDHLIRSLNLSLDTVILPLEVGLHVAYSDRRSFVGRHDGSSQFQVGIFGQFLFDGGAFVAPAGLPGR